MEIREELEALFEKHLDYRKFDLYIWGTGNTSDLYQEGLKRIENEGIIIKGYFDNNSSKWNTEYNGKKVLAPDAAKELNNLLVLISTPRPKVIKEIGAQLDLLNICWLSIDAFIVLTHRKEIFDVYNLLNDERSREVYYELTKNRIEGSYPKEEYIDGYDRYFYGPVGDCDASEVFVDCGAFVGDSFEQYIWKKEGTFKKAFLFEPDKKNLIAMENRITRLKNEWGITDDKIVVLPYGLSNSDTTGYVNRFDNNNGLGSKLLLEKTDYSEECKTVKIDSIVEDTNLFIKADIESYEYRMLLGAKDTIRLKKPKLAICIYHNSVDFYSIPLLIKEYNPDYKISVRHYSPNLSETIMYAYME